MQGKIVQNIALSGVLTSRALAPENGCSAKEHKTKLEAFEAKTGAVIIRGSGTVGSVKGEHGSTEVECKEFTDASSGKKECGILITVFYAKNRKHECYIDYDEIDSLTKGIDYMVKIDKTVTKLDDFQADFRTKGELSVSTYSDGDKVKASISSGYGSTTILSLDKLAEFKGLIQKAKAKLDSIRR